MWKFNRKKDRSVVTSISYRAARLLPLSRRLKFSIFSDLAWIFRRLAFENGGSLYAPNTYEVIQRKLEFIASQINPESVILDLGCARGYITNYLAPISRSIVGVDHNDVLIKEARNSYRKENMTFVCGDALDYLTTSKVSFDVMICSHILEHLDEPVKFLKIYKRYFDKIFVEVPDNDQDEHSHMRVACGLEPLYHDSDHIWEFRREDMMDIFKELGLTVVSSDYSFGVMRFWLRSTDRL